MVRQPSYDSNGMKKGAWSDDEDRKLRAHVLKYGHRNWRLVPVFAGLARCGKSCRLRWVNYLNPAVRRGNFTPQEEDLIIRLRSRLGNKWSVIAGKLPGRTDNEVKNHWHAHLKKRGSSRHHHQYMQSTSHREFPNSSSPRITTVAYHRQHHQITKAAGSSAKEADEITDDAPSNSIINLDGVPHAEYAGVEMGSLDDGSSAKEANEITDDALSIINLDGVAQAEAAGLEMSSWDDDSYNQACYDLQLLDLATLSAAAEDSWGALYQEFMMPTIIINNESTNQYCCSANSSPKSGITSPAESHHSTPQVLGEFQDIPIWSYLI